MNTGMNAGKNTGKKIGGTPVRYTHRANDISRYNRGEGGRKADTDFQLVTAEELIFVGCWPRRTKFFRGRLLRQDHGSEFCAKRLKRIAKLRISLAIARRHVP